MVNSESTPIMRKSTDAHVIMIIFNDAVLYIYTHIYLSQLGTVIMQTA